MIHLAGALASAVLLSLCFPSSGKWWMAWLALAPLIAVVRLLEGRGYVFWYGYLVGFLFFFLTLFWIHHVTFIGLVLLCAYLAVYWAVFAQAVAWSARWSPVWRMLFVACAWTACEYMRAHAFTGFGWAMLAHTQSANTLLIQVADITGAYGVSFLLVAFNAIVADVIAARMRMDARGRQAVRVVLVALLAVLAYGVWCLSSVPWHGGVRAALVQGNISLADYRDPRLKAYVVRKHLEFSRQALDAHPDLIIWPETSFPQFIWEYADLFEEVRDFARTHRVRLMLGAVTREKELYFNTAILINERGELESMYRKQHLVVLGEYIPWRRQFPWLARVVPIDDFTPGSGQVLLNAGRGGIFAALICFEDTVAGLARDAVNAGAGFLVNLTNDAWFGFSRQPAMHLDNAVFRAVENRVSLLRATNTGMSCAILPTGDKAGCVEDAKGHALMTSGVRVVDVPSGAWAGAFYRKFGDVFAMLCFAGILGAGLFIKAIRRNKNV